MRRSILYTIGVFIGALMLSACGNDDDVVDLDSDNVRRATVTLLTTPNGLGDNGYNDDAAEGFFAFGQQTGTKLRLLLPNSLEEAEVMYRQWLEQNATQDSAVLILGSSAYDDLARRNHATLSGQGSRVLLFESNAPIDGISTVMIGRYGVSWLAGAMSKNFDALILAAAPGFPSLEESIAGFQNARELYAGEYYESPCKTTLHYLADGEEGFAIPDSAYHFLARRADDAFFYDEMIFPLLGGSEAGLLRFLNDDEFMMALMIGMDVDQTGQSSRIPFSVVIRIGDVLKQYLNDWLTGREWPAYQRFGLKDGAADIVMTSHFTEYLEIADQRYDDPDIFLSRYKEFKDEAIRKEEEYGK